MIPLLLFLAQLPESTRAAIDRAVTETLLSTQTPSASIAIAKDGRHAYVHAFGDARLEPRTAAAPAMRYKIASNSKQITATAILLLAEEGKLSLDDKVSRFLPDLTRANEVTIRNLLSHTSGYQDYYPLDYVAPFMKRDIAPSGILDTWARKPLDFSPGTQWQYSNTNYAIAGVIIEKLTKKPLIDFLRERIFTPLKMQSPVDVGRQPWSPSDPAGYTRFALGPPRPVTPEGNGWMYAAGELAMTAGDLALWDISLIDRTLLKPESLRALTTEVRLNNGAGTAYALGLAVSNRNGHREWAHNGGAAGFISRNVTLPDDKISITVLTNGEGPAASMISRRIQDILTAPSADPHAADTLDTARRVFLDLQNGKLDRAAFTDDALDYFSPRVIADYAASLKPLGEPSSFTQDRSSQRGGMTERFFTVKTSAKTLTVSTYFTPDGSLAQFLVFPLAR